MFQLVYSSPTFHEHYTEHLTRALTVIYQTSCAYEQKAYHEYANIHEWLQYDLNQLARPMSNTNSAFLLAIIAMPIDSP